MRVPSSPKRLRKCGVLFLPLSISQQLPLHCAKAPITVECGDDMLDPGRQTFCSRVAFWRQRHLAAWKHISWLSCQESGEEGRRICWIPPFLFIGYLFNSNSNSFQFQEQPSPEYHVPQRAEVNGTGGTCCLWWGEEALYNSCYANPNLTASHIIWDGKGKPWVAVKSLVAARAVSMMKLAVKISSLNLIGVKRNLET